jgi:hypothetical protein
VNDIELYFIALCPQSYFNLNKSAFLGMIGTVLTYIILLMQFKVGTLKEQECEEKKNCNATTATENTSSYL